MEPETPIRNEVVQIQAILHDQDIRLSLREREEYKRRLWELEHSSFYCEQRLAEDYYGPRKC